MVRLRVTLSLAHRANRWGDRTAAIDVSESRRDAPAETVDEDRYTYADLDDLASRLADRLAALDVGSGDAVCAVSRNRLECLALPFACRRLGAAYAPLSHRLTPATAGRPVERIEPALVLHETAQRDLVRELPVGRKRSFEELAQVDPDGDDSPERGSSGESDSANADGVAADRGGTLLCLHDDEGGLPVARFHESAVEWNCVSVEATLGLGRTDRTFALVPLSTHDGLLRAALPTLYAGGTVLFDRAFDPGDALAALQRDRPTVLAGRAAEFRDLLAREGDADVRSSVDLAVCEAPVPPTVREAALDAGLPLSRAYGRLECPTALVESDAVPGSDGGTDPDVAGRPALDCRARLVDGDGSAVSGSGTGTLRLSGPVVATGYVESGVRRGEGDETDGPARRGTFLDGWFDTGERFRRTEDGTYHPD